MTIYKSTKIGLAVASFALVAQLTNGLISEEPVNAPINVPTAQTQQVETNTTSSVFNECMDIRGPRTYEERGASDRSATERKSRTEINAERQAKCEAEQQASVNENAQTVHIGGGNPYTGGSQQYTAQGTVKNDKLVIEHITPFSAAPTQP